MTSGPSIPQVRYCRPFDKKWERKLLRSASAVVFVTEASRNAYLASIDGLDGSKCLVVPNGWDPDDFAVEPVSSTRNPVANRGKLLISFVGSTGWMADPDAFLARFQEVLVRCPSLRERLIYDSLGQNRTNFVVHSQVSRINSRIRSSSSTGFPNLPPLRRCVELVHCSFCWIRSTTRRYPGKLYEYLAAGAPILVFGDTGTRWGPCPTPRCGLGRTNPRFFPSGGGVPPFATGASRSLAELRPDSMA